MGKHVMPVWAALLLSGLGATTVPVGAQAQAPQAGVAPAGWWSAQWVIR